MGIITDYDERSSAWEDRGERTDAGGVWRDRGTLSGRVDDLSGGRPGALLGDETGLPLRIAHDMDRQRREPDLLEQLDELDREHPLPELPVPALQGLDIRGPLHGEPMVRRVEEENVEPRWEYFEEDTQIPQDVAARLTVFLEEGLITVRELDAYLSEAFRTNRIPSRRWFQVRQLNGWLDNRVISEVQYKEWLGLLDKPGFRLPKNLTEMRVVKCKDVLKGMKEAMNEWELWGMRTREGTVLEALLRPLGRWSKQRGLGAQNLSDLDAGKERIRRIWSVLEPAIAYAVDRLDDLESIGYDWMFLQARHYHGVNEPVLRGFTLNWHYVQNAEVFDLALIIVHELQHDSGQLGRWHSAKKGWVELYGDEGRWDQMMTWAMQLVQQLLQQMPEAHGGRVTAKSNRWTGILRASGEEPD